MPPTTKAKKPEDSSSNDFCYQLARFAFAKTVEQFTSGQQQLEQLAELNRKENRGHRCPICHNRVSRCGCLGFFIRNLTLGRGDRSSVGNARCSSYQAGYRLRKELFRAERSWQTLELLLAEHRRQKSLFQKEDGVPDIKEEEDDDDDDLVVAVPATPTTTATATATATATEDDHDSDADSLTDINFDEAAEDIEGPQRSDNDGDNVEYDDDDEDYQPPTLKSSKISK